MQLLLTNDAVIDMHSTLDYTEEEKKTRKKTMNMQRKSIQNEIIHHPRFV